MCRCALKWRGILQFSQGPYLALVKLSEVIPCSKRYAKQGILAVSCWEECQTTRPPVWFGSG